MEKRLTELARRKEAYKSFEDTIEALKEDNRVNTSELQKNHLEGKIERSKWTVEKMILDQEKRCIEQIEALYLSRNDDSAFKHYLEYEHEHHYKIWKESDDNMRYARLVVYEVCLEAFNKAHETTKERP